LASAFSSSRRRRRAASRSFFIKTILGTDGAIRIEDKMQDSQPKLYVGGGFVIADRGSRRFVEGVEDPQLLRKALAKFSNVAAISEVVRGNVMVQSALRNDTAQIFGHHPRRPPRRLRHRSQRSCSAARRPFRIDDIGLMIGRTLADRLDVTVGEPLTMEFRGDRRRYRVDAIYDTATATSTRCASTSTSARRARSSASRSALRFSRSPSSIATARPRTPRAWRRC